MEMEMEMEDWIQIGPTQPRKLPIKRKSPSSIPNPNPNSTPKIQTRDEEDLNHPQAQAQAQAQLKKLQRIWTEGDEISFLQGLVDLSAEGLVFPRDLHLFYPRFSQSTNRHYTKSQLSDKLRRLRNKFRLVSARIRRGLHPDQLSMHDHSLFHLSKHLWHPYSSPACNTNKIKSSSLNSNSSPGVRVKISFNPTFIPPSSTTTFVENLGGGLDGGEGEEPQLPITSGDGGGEPQLSNNGGGGGGGEIGRTAAKAVVDVFESSLQEVRSVLAQRGLVSSGFNASSQQGKEKVTDLMMRWREQRLTELDAMARRLRLVLDNSLRHR